MVSYCHQGISQFLNQKTTRVLIPTLSDKNIELSFGGTFPAKQIAVSVIGGGMTLGTTMFMIDKIKSGPPCEMKP